MLLNYLLIAQRTMRKRKAYVAINIAGLAVGMACCLLIVLYVHDELRYDAFHERADRIYRVVASTDEDGQPTNANGPFAAGPALEADFPEVERAVRLCQMGWGETRTVVHEDRRFAEAGFLFADSTVFDVFTFPLVAGDPATALRGPQRVVITERAAERYFAGADPVGQTLSIDAYNDGVFEAYTVTGVMEDVPAASHLQFDLLASFESQRGPLDSWGFDPVYTYVLLAPGADAGAVAARLGAFLERYVGAGWWYTLDLQPLRAVHLGSGLRAEPTPTTDVRYVYLFSAVAVFILLLACVNFMNLATAQAEQRAREVGMRKVLGAVRRQLVGQFLSEALLMSLAAALFALALTELGRPLLNAVAGKTLTLGSLPPLFWAGGVFGLALLVGLLAGSYPALVLSGFAPLTVLQGRVQGGRPRGARLRQGLVVFQFAVTIALLVCTAVVYRQMQLVRHKNLGFQRDQLVVLPLNNDLRERYDAFREALLQHPGVQDLTATEQVPARAGNGSTYRIETLDEPEGFTRLLVNRDFIRTYGIDLVAGRDFPADRDDRTAYIVNEAFIRAVGWTHPEEAVGKQIQLIDGGIQDAPEGTIVGVARDFNLFSLREGVYAAVMSIVPLDYLNFVSVRVAPDQATGALAHLRQTWTAFVDRYPFDYYFLDDDFARLHRADERLGQVFGFFAGLAVFVACLGLFGLAAYTAEQRTKEIGIRKVLGASTAGVVGLLTRDFMVLVGLAFTVGAPLAYLAMHRWLEAFEYRVEIGAGLLVAAGGAALLVALLTAGSQALRAARTNPADALRYE